jgi:RNA polymerase sigma factor (sigma-70 family)
LAQLCFNSETYVSRSWKPFHGDETSLLNIWHMTAQKTSASLLLRIKDRRDESAWAEFLKVYMPLVYSYGLKYGLQDSDSADLAQETMRRVVRSIDAFEYDPARGSFRGWLLTVARNELRRMKSRLDGTTTGSGDTEVILLLEQEPSRSEEDKWEVEYQLHLFHWAVKQVQVEFREPTWRAFCLTVIENVPIEQAAQLLTLTPGAIYIARSRVLARIRSLIASIEGEAGGSLG